jgi:hypothetical protein
MDAAQCGRAAGEMRDEAAAGFKRAGPAADAPRRALEIS